MMRKINSSLLLLALLVAPLQSRAADPAAYEALKGAGSVGWSLNQDRTAMVVAVSPARQTLQIAGSAGTVLGIGISAVANEKYRKAIEEVLQGYDGAAVIRERVAARLGAALGERAREIDPMGSTAGYNNVRDAEKERLGRLAEAGQNLVLDLTPEYGLFGYQGLLIVKLEAKLYNTESGHKVWSENLMASPEFILASDKLKDPTQQLAPNLTDPRFSASEDAIAQWTGDGGAAFRERFEGAVDGCISALLTDLGLAQEAQGAYYLGRVNLMRKKFETAEAYFDMALKLDPAHVPSKNGLSVLLAHTDRVDEAIALATEITTSAPEFGPAHYNLAWWLAVEKKDAATAAPHYEQAKALGMPTSKKIEKALGAE